MICTGMPAPAMVSAASPGHLLREKTRVIADDNPAIRLFMTQNVGGNSARHPAHVVKSKIVGNQAAPAIGAKFDIAVIGLVIGRQSLASRLLQGLDMADDRGPTTNDYLRLLHQISQLLLVQILHYFSDILGLVSSGDQ